MSLGDAVNPLARWLADAAVTVTTGDAAAALDRELRRRVVPVDRRIEPDRWGIEDFVNVTGAQMRRDAWGAEVPGSGAYDSMLLGAVASQSQLGFDVGAACPILAEGLAAKADGDDARCVELADRLLDALAATPKIPRHAYHRQASISAVQRDVAERIPKIRDVDVRIHAGWVGQIAGGAFGTALEGCTGEALRATYGVLDHYVAAPVTLNDDCVYELLALDVLAELGSGATAADFGAKWKTELPFAWSAEWIALENLRSGVEAPESGRLKNPMHDWIGAQMRGMVFGLVAPGRPGLAAELAAREASVSHAGNGVWGGVYAAAMTALAFTMRHPRSVLAEAKKFVPDGSEYATVIDQAIKVCSRSSSAEDAWAKLDATHASRNWIHAYPNIAAVCVALWFGRADFTRSFSILGDCGLDVDCNAGLVGTVLGVMHASVPDAWAGPLDGRFATYLPGRPEVDIAGLAERTAVVARQLR